MASEEVKLGSAVTVQREAVMVGIDHGSIVINKAGVVMADVEKSNGVIHVIDAVLLPK